MRCGGVLLACFCSARAFLSVSCGAVVSQSWVVIVIVISSSGESGGILLSAVLAGNMLIELEQSVNLTQ
jgi:hypothetical protein